MSRSALRLVVLLLALASLSPQAPAPAYSQPACPPARPSDAVRLAVERREANALIADAAIQLDSPAPVYLEYGNPEAGWLRTPTAPAALQHALPILRLRADSAYEVRAFALDAAGCPSLTATAELTTGPLPGQLRTSVQKAVGQASYPLSLMDHRLLQPGEIRRVSWFAAADAGGHVVWYYRIPPDLPITWNTGSATTIKRRPNGNFLYQAGAHGFEEITPDGRPVRRIKIEASGDGKTNHHDFAELPDGRLLFISNEDRELPDPTTGQRRLIRGDVLHAVEVDTARTVALWSSFSMLDPFVRQPHRERELEDQAEDWTHLNTVSIGPRGNVVLSLRNLDQVLSLRPDLKSIEWRLGGPGSDFSFPDPSDRFYGQHTAVEIAPGRVLMFDNGPFRPEGEYSRGLELELDFAAMTARKTWEYRHRPDFLARLSSSAERLPNGNTVLNFGTNTNHRNGFTMAEFGFVGLDNAAPVLTVEARPDGTAAWQHWLEWAGGQTSRYRVYPLESLTGESAVEPTPIVGAPPAGLRP